MNEVKNVQFFGGRLVSFLPFGIFVFIAVYISVLGAPDIRGMWVAALLGIMVTFFLSKEKEKYSLAIIEGMADKIAIVPVAAWIFAGVFATVLRESGLVEGILWGAYNIGATGTWFVVISFIASSIFATATGTSFGTIIGGMAVLYPAGVMLGADPLVLAGAIIGGGAFGDNIAPISDTTISSAASQGVDIGGVVKSRIIYVIPATIITLVLLAIFGGGNGAAQAIPYDQLSEHMNPMGLIMLIPAALTIWLAIKGAHLISATTVGTIVGVIIAGIFNLNSFSNLLYIEDGAVKGLFINGMSGMIDICILALLLMACVNIMRVGDGDKALISFSEKVVKTARGAEASIASLILGMCAVMGLNAPPILAVGLSYAKPIGKRFNIHPYRIANVMDAFSNTIVFTLPWTPALLLVTAASVEANTAYGSMVPVISATQIVPWIFYCWVLLAVMIFAVITGWGRKFTNTNTNESKEYVLKEKI